jgi:hypothetical protein
MVTPLDKKLSLRHAAKAVHRSRRYIRSLIDTGKVKAYKIGGSDRNPWLAVYLDELEEAIRKDSVYVPPALAGRKVRASPGDLHPLVSSW